MSKISIQSLSQKIVSRDYNSLQFILIFTSVLSAFGPFVTDLYLPALPVMSESFNTGVSMVQMSLTVSLIGLASGQLLFGPVSDKFGRKLPLLVSLFVFIISTIGCIFSRSIESFVFFRLLQGFAGAGGIVISKSIAVDLYEKDKLSKFMSMLAAINALAPILAPLAGALLLKYTNWQGIFDVLLLIGIVIFIMAIIFKESLASNKRHKGNVFRSFLAFKVVLSNKKFLYYTMALALVMGLFFSYLSASPFIFQTLYRVSALLYGIFFALNAIGLMIGTRLSILFSNSEKAIAFGATALIGLSVLMSVFLFIQAPVFIVEAGFFLLLTAAGIILPEGTTLALNLERENAGSASACIGFFQFILGGIVSPLVGIGNIMYSTGIMLIICGLLCWFFIRKAIKA